MSHTNDLPRTVSLEPDERQECPSRMSSDHSRMSSDHSRTSSEGGTSSWGGSSVDDVTALHQQSGYIKMNWQWCVQLFVIFVMEPVVGRSSSDKFRAQHCICMKMKLGATQIKTLINV